LKQRQPARGCHLPPSGLPVETDCGGHCFDEALVFEASQAMVQDDLWCAAVIDWQNQIVQPCGIGVVFEYPD